MSRDFNSWLDTMTDTVASWTYYTDFPKVYRNVDKYKREAHLLNSLIGSKNIENEFEELIKEYPKTLRVVPLLLAKRGYDIQVKGLDKDYNFNFNKMNYSIKEYSYFMEKSGLFDLIQNHLISNIYDYLIGVEVGLDTNARKNRTGHAMEDTVESFIQKAGYKKNETYYKEMYKNDIENKFGISLDFIIDENRANKRFDFVLNKNGHIYAIETNFYSSGGSKLNETARSYKNIAIDSREIDNFSFIWITDGQGWNSAKNNLRETFYELPTLYNINDMRNGAIENL